MSWRVDVDRTACIGSGVCAGIAPEHFELVENRSIAKRTTVEPADGVLDAASSCPMEAIVVRDLADDRILAP